MYRWHISDGFIFVDGTVPYLGTGLLSLKVASLKYNPVIMEYASKYKVNPILILTLSMMYSKNNEIDPTRISIDPGWVSDNSTPNRVRIGLTGIRLSTARQLDVSTEMFTRHDLIDERTNIRCACMWIARLQTRPIIISNSNDPILLFASWDAGGVRKHNNMFGIFVNFNAEMRILQFIKSWNSARGLL